MCNHYRFDPAKHPDWAQYFGAEVPNDWSQTRIDTWPRKAASILRRVEGQTVIDEMIWGVPHTMAGKRPGTTKTNHVTNVRNLTSPFWRSMLARPEQRCLVPFTEFAEPKIGEGRGEWWFTVKEAPVSCFAGIWRPTAVGNAFAFLTCEPNPLVAPLHPKAMPVVLRPEDYDAWLTTVYPTACALAQPFPSQMMTVA
jgi:putative SOS response-associated peptidase YedK